MLPGSLDPLRRLALGHWLRRWWPASRRDGIAALDGALLDAELAVLTARAQDFFTDDTLDSDVAGLLRPHSAALTAHLHGGDPRVIELVRICAELADDVGVAFGEADRVPLHRDDYALAAGADMGRHGSTAIATGADSVNWGAVPPGIFDAAENTVGWRIEAAEAKRPVTESAAWDHDWRSTAVTVGVDLKESVESPQTRERIRDFARARLRGPAGDAFLAEVLAAESDY